MQLATMSVKCNSRDDSWYTFAACNGLSDKYYTHERLPDEACNELFDSMEASDISALFVLDELHDITEWQETYVPL